MKRHNAVIFVLAVAVAGAVGFGTLAELPDTRSLPETCDAPFSAPRIGEPRPGQPPTLAIDVVPQTRQVNQNRTAVFHVCIGNPKENNQSVDPIVALWHSGEETDRMYIVGPDVSLIPTDNHVGKLPMDVPINGGMGRYIYGGTLEPGEITQYTIVASNLTETGRYDVQAEPLDLPDIGHNEGTLTVACSLSCAIAVGIEAVERFLDEYGMLILGILGTSFTILGVLVSLYGSETVLSALRFWKESGSSQESGQSEEES